MRSDVFIFFFALLLIFFLLILKAIERRKSQTVLLPNLRRWADHVVVKAGRTLWHTTRFIWHKSRRNVRNTLRHYSRNLRSRLIRLLGGRQ